MGGYVHLWANLASTVATNCVSLENAPYVTLVFALVVQLIPFAVVLWSDSPFWLPPARKTAGVCILLFAPLSGEIWLNTLQSQMFFTLATFLLLMEDAPTAAVKRWGYRLVLLLGGLTGPGSCITTPFFLLRAWKDRNKERLIQGVILSACSAVQGSLLWLFPTHCRGAIDLGIYALALWNQSIGMVLLGLHEAVHFGNLFMRLYREESPWFLPAALASAVVIGLIVAFFAKAVPSRDRWILVGMYFFLTFVCYCGALLGPSGKCDYLRTCFGQRYYFVPNVIFLLLILARCRGPMRFGRVVATIVLVTSLGLGIVEYRKTVMRDVHWPKWKDEVRAWRQNPAHEVAIWPPGWHFKLASMRRCADPSPIPAQQDALTATPSRTRR
jgi:hypothetical protein